jgi:LCP family protein required for cell wall assembly
MSEAPIADDRAPDLLPDPPQEPAPRVGGTPSAPRLLLLNAVFPGLGHLVAGRRRWAIFLAVPLLLALIAVLAIGLTSSSTSLAARLFDPAVLTVLLLAQGVVVLWRLFAVGATRVLTPLRPTATTIVAGLVAVAIVIAPQLLVAGVTIDARDAAAEVFEAVDEGAAWEPSLTPPPVASDDPDFAITLPSPSSSPSPTPSASPTPEVPRVNVLLIGMDSGVGRNTALTDTMIVVSLDPVAKTVSMVSIPRDMVDVPLPDGRTYRGKINGLVSYVRWNPGKFPGAKSGQAVLSGALGELLDLKINRCAQVNLAGFVNLVNSVGGVVINVTDGFCDPRYDEYGIDGFGISPGRYKLNGNQALAYARVRKAAGESDFTRASRQQELIAALRDRLVKGAFLDNPSKFLKSLGETIRTNVKPSFIADYIDTAADVPRKSVYRVVIKSPLVRGTSDERGSIQKPNIEAIRKMAARLFTPTGTVPKGFDTMPSAGSGPTKSASSSASCGVKATPRPTPRATPRPPPKPTPKPTPKPSTATPKPTPAPTPPPTPVPTPEPTPVPPSEAPAAGG